MKRLALACLLALAWGVNGRGQFIVPINLAKPTLPSSPLPADGTTGVAASPTLSCIVSGATTFTLLIGTTNPPLTPATGASCSFPETSLTASTTYYWQITATNGIGSVAGPVWSFTTAAGGSGGTTIVVHLTKLNADTAPVSIGLPLVPGVLSDSTKVRVFNDATSVEISGVTTKALMSYYDGAGTPTGIRAVLVQFPITGMTTTDMDARIVVGTDGSAGTSIQPFTTIGFPSPETVNVTDRHIALNGGVYSFTEDNVGTVAIYTGTEPKVLVTYPDGYLASTGIMAKQISRTDLLAKPKLQGLKNMSDEWALYANSMMYNDDIGGGDGYKMNRQNIYSPLNLGAAYPNSNNFEGWLYDRCVTYLQAYIHFHQTKYLRFALRLCSYYAGSITVDGVTSIKPDPDSKYSHSRGLFAYYAITGDEVALQAMTRIADMWNGTGGVGAGAAGAYFTSTYKATFNGTSWVTGHMKGSQTLWTERLLAFSLEGLTYAFLATGNTAYRTTAQGIFETAYVHITTADQATLTAITNTAAPWSNLPPQNGFIHNAYQQSEGNEDEPWISMWMSELTVDSFIRYAEVFNDQARVDQVFIRLARYFRDMGSMYEGKRPGLGWNIVEDPPNAISCADANCSSLINAKDSCYAASDDADLSTRRLIPPYGSGISYQNIKLKFPDYNDYLHCPDASAIMAAAIPAAIRQGTWATPYVAGPFHTEGEAFTSIYHELINCSRLMFPEYHRVHRNPSDPFWTQGQISGGYFAGDPVQQTAFINANNVGGPSYTSDPQRKVSWQFNTSALSAALLDQTGIDFSTIYAGFVQGSSCGAATPLPPSLPAAPLTVCASGCNYTDPQAAIAGASCGDTITLRAGQTFTGSFTLTNKGCSTDITIRSDAADVNLPGPTVRTGPSYAAFLPKLKSNGGGSPAMQIANGATHWRLLHLEFLPTPAGFYTNLSIGSNNADEAFRSQLADYITVDRVYLHADPVSGQQRQIMINAKHVWVLNSWCSAGTPEIDADGQCIAGWNGEGPYVLDNNHLEGGTETLIIGGSDPAIHTWMTINSSTTTTATVTVSNSGHTLAELAIGDVVGFPVSGDTRTQYGTLTNISSTSTTGTLTFTGVTIAPDVGGTARAGVVLGDRVNPGLTVTHNHLLWTATDRTNPIIAAATSPSATAFPTGGVLAAGSHCYKIVGYNPNGHENNTMFALPTSEVCAVTTGSTGRVDLSWTASATMTNARVYGRGTTGAEDRYLATAATTLTDDGSAWTVASIPAPNYWRHKNLAELKAAANIVFRGNILENHWDTAVGSAQSTWWKSADQGDTCTYCWTHNVLAELNWWRHVRGWLEIVGQESYHAPLGSRNPPPITDFTVKNNLVCDSGYGNGGDVFGIQLGNGTVRTTIDHNTILHRTSYTGIPDTSNGGGGFLVLTQGALNDIHTSPVVTNNLGRREAYGLRGDADGEGSSALSLYTTNPTVTKNAIADININIYPAGNFGESAAAWEAEFVNYTTDCLGDYRLKSTSGYHNAALDGKDLGADIAAVLAQTVHVVDGIWP